MPFYAYICDLCNRHFEVNHPMNEMLTDCPTCTEEKGIKNTLSRTLTKLNIKTLKEEPKEELSTKEEVEFNKDQLARDKELAKKRML